jgi:hypothetical protein
MTTSKKKTTTPKKPIPKKKNGNGEGRNILVRNMTDDQVELLAKARDITGTKTNSKCVLAACSMLEPLAEERDQLKEQLKRLRIQVQRVLDAQGEFEDRDNQAARARLNVTTARAELQRLYNQDGHRESLAGELGWYGVRQHNPAAELPDLPDEEKDEDDFDGGWD